MKISVVIPAYNEEKLISRCLQSLIDQTIKPDEIIVVDNNSTDSTAKLAASFAGVTIIKESRQGIVFARDAGFNAVTTNIIARCDADSILPPNWIERIHEDFENNPNLLGVTGLAVAHDIPSWMAGTGKWIHWAIYYGISHIILGHNVLFGSCQAITTKAWLKVKDTTCNDEKHMHEDVDLALHIARHGRIMIDTKLFAYVSARILREGPKKLFSRLKRWPETHFIHKDGLGLRLP
jgi:glycosyltransferase involved in cell wall biosynthesis